MNPQKVATKRGRAVEVEQALSNAIESGQYRPDSAIPSVRELAKVHHVHYNTVQTVIKRLAAKGLVTSVKRRGVFVSAGTATRSAKAPMQERVTTAQLTAPLGIMCIESLATDPFNIMDRPLVRFLEGIAAEAGRPVFRYDLNPQTLAAPAALVEHCLADHVGGVIIVGVRDTEPLEPILNQLRSGHVPVAVCPLGRQSIAASLHVPIVNSDDRLAGVVAAQHLYDLGHRNMAMVTYERARPYIDQRIAGFKAVFQLHELPFDPSRIIQLPVKEMTGQEHQRVGAEAFGMLPAGTTGVFCINDSVAAGLIGAAVGAGHQISKTLSVVGHDNDLRYDDKQITTVVPPLLQIGRRACALLHAATVGGVRAGMGAGMGEAPLDEIGEQIILRPQLLWRRSTGRRLPGEAIDLATEPNKAGGDVG